MVKTLEPQAFDEEVRSCSVLCVVAFLKVNERYRDQLNVLYEVCSEMKERVSCFLFDADYLDNAMEQFNVKGTPTFLLFEHGVEVDRLIGETDRESLVEFITNTLV